jgi:trans-2-enoyl-CoA reductase
VHVQAHEHELKILRDQNELQEARHNKQVKELKDQNEEQNLRHMAEMANQKREFDKE